VPYAAVNGRALLPLPLQLRLRCTRNAFQGAYPALIEGMAVCRSFSSRSRQSFNSSAIDMVANVAVDQARPSQATSPAIGTRTQAAIAASRILPWSKYRPLQRAISRSAATDRRTACARKNTGITVAAVA
jgi:hypothetical protein